MIAESSVIQKKSKRAFNSFCSERRRKTQSDSAETGFITDWAVNIIAWRVCFEFGRQVKCISIIGSYADPHGNQQCHRDIDILLVFDNMDEAKFGKLVKGVDEICAFLTSKTRTFKSNFAEGPVYQNVGSRSDAGKSYLVHVLVNTPKDISRWPSQIKRMRLAQHRDIYGELRGMLRVPIEIERADYLGENFGFRGLRSALQSRVVEYRCWEGRERVNMEYRLDTAWKMVNFSLYCILKSGANYLDLVLVPGFYQGWNGSNQAIDSTFQKTCKNEELKQIYAEARELSHQLRDGSCAANETTALEWQKKAKKFLTAIIDQSR